MRLGAELRGVYMTLRIDLLRELDLEPSFETQVHETITGWNVQA